MSKKSDNFEPDCFAKDKKDDHDYIPGDLSTECRLFIIESDLDSVVNNV